MIYCGCSTSCTFVFTTYNCYLSSSNVYTILVSLGWCLKGPFKHLAKEAGNKRYDICLANGAWTLTRPPQPWTILFNLLAMLAFDIPKLCSTFFIEIKTCELALVFWTLKIVFLVSSWGGHPNAVLSWLICWAKSGTQETFSLSGVTGEKIKLMNVDGWALDKYSMGGWWKGKHVLKYLKKSITSTGFLDCRVIG